MKRPGSSRTGSSDSRGNPGHKGNRTALAGIVSFFRQLSLFDAVPPEPAAPAALSRAPEAALKGSVASQPDPHPRPQPASSGSLASAAPSFAELCRGPYAHIQVVPGKRLWESWRVAWTRRNEALRLDVPAILEESPRTVKEAVLEWSVLVTRRGGKRDPVLRARRSDLESLIRDHLRAPGGAVPSRAAEKRLARNRRKVERLQPQGTHHDLDAAFRAVNARYFAGTLQARLTWSARLGGLSTHCLAQDGEGATYHLISISRGYDDPEVTPEILGGVVYHECLHIVIPPRREGGRRVVHGPDFRRREREYDHFEAWRKWHRYGLPRVLRRLGKRKSR
ncbi:MAG TPA: hypothetical protein VJ385_18300 [Fibrobacteria bacterium]|nr:hypothetical protein [Fibrobacteria bacterium]